MITDPGFYNDPAYAAQSVPPEDAPSAAPAGDGAGLDTGLDTGLDAGLDTVPRAGIARVGDPVAVWPCAGCGRPVPQPVRGARTVRYCQDTGGACERAAHEQRERAREVPGLTGQVAWTWEMVERLEAVADRLAGSLVSELGVAGVERRVADARADAAGEVAIAQRERDASQRQAEAAWRETTTARARADAAEEEAAAARAAAEQAAAERDTARREGQEAMDTADAAVAAQLAAERERDRIASREGELLAALETARTELVGLHGRLSETETVVEGQRIEAAAARRAADDLRAAVRDAETQRGQAVADRDQIQARAREIEERNWDLSRANEELRAAVQTLTAERDAARAEADRARRRVDALTRPADPRPDGRPAADREPPTGLHPLPPLNGSSLNGSSPHASSRSNGSSLDGTDPLAVNGHRLPHAG
ncbi:chromosome segregation ATPase [Actinomadura sp. NPDC048394]|uniref:chromosome segregation ATPase n=1 Tax=Actinomadura sp. NPDC048394 TaxID=3158223 RepID=UPI0033E74FDB